MKKTYEKPTLVKRQKLTERTMFTEFGQLIGTFEYMSPEQAKLNQLEIDTRSDIYSLGVLLYELVTGECPYSLGHSEREPLERAIRTADPICPSRAAVTQVLNGWVLQALCASKRGIR